MELHFKLAAFLQRRPHRTQSKLGRVTIAAEMSKNDSFDLSRQQLLDYTRRRCVRQMAMPRLNSLFHRPRPMRIVLQQFLVVIGLDYERLHRTQSFNDHFGHVTEVGDESQASRAGVKREP